MATRSAPVIIASVIATVSIGTAVVVATTTPGSAAVPRAAAALPHDDATASPTPVPTVTVTVTPTPTFTATPKPTPKPTLHLTSTIRIRSTNVDVVNLGHGKQIVTAALRRGGRDAGRGVSTCTPGGATFSCKSAYALSGGVLIFRDTVNFSQGKVTGTVTGGSGKYAGAHGTVRGAESSHGGVHITIVYYSNNT
ncbi:MAG TPA: hypothetical protein VHB18_01510 [Mycobacteriales bacterium]|nr:hypothetical protein [Mycobacteriales bacterium]